MKVIIETIAGSDEEQVIVRCHKLRPHLLQVLDNIDSEDCALIAYHDKDIYRIEPLDIFYIEGVDARVFIYLEKEVYESRQKLFELEEELASDDFLRVSKSTVLNLRKVSSFTPISSGRFEATLKNGEKILISRKYVGNLRRVLGF